MSGGQPRAAVVVLAAGSGSRVGHDLNKVLLPLGGKPVFAWSLETAAGSPSVARVILVVAERDRSLDEVVAVASRLDAEIVVGGDTRHESERLALESLAADIEGGRLDVVVMHDAARPLATADLLATVIATAHRRGGAVPVRPQPSVIAADDRDRGSVRGEFVAVQTPQAFRAGPLLTAYRAAHAQHFVGTDTASCVEAFTDLEVVGVPGPADNIKVTFADDLAVVERLMSLTPDGAERRSGDRPAR
jgi:2-C-methyl-D-erythritol 4-phosphate cytidylyltransferase